MTPALASAGVTLVATAAACASAGVFGPGLLAGVAAGVVAGVVVHLAGRPAAAAADDARLAEMMAANSQLRHDLRGALSPALLVSDRLTSHADPAVAKAGGIVVRAVEKSTQLLEVNKQDEARPAPPGGAVSPPAR